MAAHLLSAETVQSVELPEVPPVVDGAHARLLGLMVVGVHHDGQVICEWLLAAEGSVSGAGGRVGYRLGFGLVVRVGGSGLGSESTCEALLDADPPEERLRVAEAPAIYGSRWVAVHGSVE